MEESLGFGLVEGRDEELLGGIVFFFDGDEPVVVGGRLKRKLKSIPYFLGVGFSLAIVYFFQQSIYRSGGIRKTFSFSWNLPMIRK